VWHGRLRKKLIKRFIWKGRAKLQTFEFLKFVGPGLLVTVGFIDPGNWASNVAAGSNFGYYLLWMVTLSTVMLIFLQHNAAHLGIVTGLCLSEACAKFYPAWMSGFFLASAVCAVVATSLAEVLGAAIGLQMLFGLPLPAGAAVTVLLAAYLLLSNSYQRLEKWIICFVSLIGLSFLFELAIVKIEWRCAVQGWVIPSIPSGSLVILMSVLGAVVMPHNLFLHSEIIQSRRWNLEKEEVIRKQLKFEFFDTFLGMCVGWAINSAMILVAASVFFSRGIIVNELHQAQATLRPLLGSMAATVFALALCLAGFSSSITGAMAGGSIFAGMFQEPFDVSKRLSRIGILLTLCGALPIIFLIKDPLKGLIWSQVALSIQLPLTVYPLLFLTSSAKVMGRFANSLLDKILLGIISGIVLLLNILLLVQTI
jgi:manganese transport protein